MRGHHTADRQGDADMAAGDQPTSTGGSRGTGLLGQTIGDFEIIEEIGRGGMGVVFRARQNSLDRMVAFKILSHTLGLRDHAVARFQREAQATAQLYHPNIIPIYAQGHQDQTYYYAMELVSGRSLYDIIRELRTDGAGVRGGMESTGSASDHVGGSSIASDMALAETELLRPGSDSGHWQEASPGRDRVVTGRSASRSGSQDDPRFAVYDEACFDNIAKQIRDVADALEYAHRQGIIHRDIKPHNLLVGHGDRLCLTDFGLARVLAQPGMTQTGEFVGSPLYMAPEQITGRSDIVGATADIYSLGATLYEWLTLSPPFPAATREQVISQVITSDVLPPRARNRRVPADLATICLKALEKDPSCRYQSAAELRDDLSRFLNRAKIKAQRAGVLTILGRTLSRRRTAAIAAVAAAIIVALSFMLVRERQQTHTREVTDATPVAATATTAPVAAEPSPPPADMSQLIASRMEFGEQMARMLGGEAVLSGILSSGDEDVYTPTTDEQRIGAAFLVGLREAEKDRLQQVADGSFNGTPADTQYLHALAASSADIALDDLDECLQLDPDHHDARLLRAWVRCQLGRIPDMLADAEALVSAVPENAHVRVARGAARLLLHDLDGAGEDLAFAADHLDGDYRVDELAGLLHMAKRQTDRALAAFGRSLTLSPNSALARLHRAELNLAQGYAAPALADATYVVTLEPDNAEAYELRGGCYDKLERYDEAKLDYFKAYGISGRAHLVLKAYTAAAKREEQNRVAGGNSEPSASPHLDADSVRKQDQVPDNAPKHDPGSVRHWWQGFFDGMQSPVRPQPPVTPRTYSRIVR